MYCRVLACDFDGTGASDGHLAPEVAAALARARGLGFVTLLVTGRVLEEIHTLSADCSIFDAVVASLLQGWGPLGLVAADALASVDLPWAGLLVEDEQVPRWQIFTPGRRTTEHTHHARKYADTQLPEDQAFRFLHTGEGRPVVAHNVAEFYAALQSLPPASLRHHLISGDFSRWAADVLGNQRLGSGLRRIERTTATGATVSRAEILACIDAEYAISTPLPVAGRGAAANNVGTLRTVHAHPRGGG